ncbi:thiamine biosynthesis protein ThiF [Taibaiella sp. KBW10]|uniref:HesA/MoeB/ThiF family protein n=1 Tax=Taibaiella sp. KBW10 TaxID=2153357 RepID=UPI000F5A08F9|nr:HesA/MoeB/ThiF family protein [Taibaiella sp. KBW10]RQO30364.1 thiamine biosynthesis protein ThiF [Taibaiella sp. KBW10]
MITKETFQRYNRQILIPEIGIQGQTKIQAAKVLVVGAGGLGCPVLQYLAAAGVGTIGIIDFDTVALHNLHRQLLHKEESIGCAKVTSALEHLKSLNSNPHYNIYQAALSTDNIMPIVGAYDIIVDGSDNFATRYLVNDTCVALGKPLVYGSILNFEGQMAVFNQAGSKNLRDLFPQPPDAEAVPDCDSNGVVGTLPGIIGTMMAQETIKMIVGMPVLRNELLLFQTRNWRLQKINF